MTNRFRRLISAQELADLSDEWQNATVDTSKYYMTVLSAYECDSETFHKWNGPKQIHEGRFYIGGQEEV